MKLDWARIVSAGLVAQIVLTFVFRMVVLKYGQGTVSNATVVLGAFVFMTVGALWVGRRIESRFVLHGLLVGVVAVAFYLVETLPTVLSGRYEDYWLSALGGHTPKLVGGLFGGYLAGRLKNAARQRYRNVA